MRHAERAGGRTPARHLGGVEYVSEGGRLPDGRTRRRLPFLWMYESPDRAARVRRGEVVAAPAAALGAQAMPDGLFTTGSAPFLSPAPALMVSGRLSITTTTIDTCIARWSLHPERSRAGMPAGNFRWCGNAKRAPRSPQGPQLAQLMNGYPKRRSRGFVNSRRQSLHVARSGGAGVNWGCSSRVGCTANPASPVGSNSVTTVSAI